MLRHLPPEFKYNNPEHAVQLVLKGPKQLKQVDSQLLHVEEVLSP